MQNKITAEYIQYLQKISHADGVLNIVSLLANLRLVSRIENIIDTVSFGNSLEYMGLLYKIVGVATFYVSKNQVILDRAIEADGRKKNSHVFGKLLGYPECCIRAFMDVGGIGDTTYFEYLKNHASLKENSHFSHYTNIFENKRIYHIPCSFDCQKSILIGQRMEKLFLSVNKILPKEYGVYPKKYLLFKTGEWVRFQKDSTSWGKLYGKNDTPIADSMITCIFKSQESDHEEIIKKNSQEQILEYLEFHYI